MQKAKKQELGHFYILETSASDESAQEKLLKFIHQFIKDYYQKVEGHKQSLSHLMDHPDVYVLGDNDQEEKDKSEKSFKVEEAEALSRFFEYRPVQGYRKFAVITEAHRINQTVANKWLKLFEEPIGHSTIFLLNPRRVQLLPTIHSRAIHLRLMPDRVQRDKNQWIEFVGDVKKMTLSEFLEQYSRGDIGLSFWINETINWESEQSDQAGAKFHLENLLKEIQEMEAFNQPSATKWSLFYAYLKDHVLNRLN
jgi:hypothetical protein